MAVQTEAYAGDPTNTRLADRMLTLWRSFNMVNSFYIKLKVRGRGPGWDLPDGSWLGWMAWGGASRSGSEIGRIGCKACFVYS
jgi:hypothetical protein